MELSPTAQKLLAETKKRIQARAAEKELHEDFFLPVIPDWALLEAIQVGISERILGRLPLEDRQKIRAFEDNLRRRSLAIGAARTSLLQRLREFVATHGHHGGKGGRADYSALIGLDEIERLEIALAEYDRVHDEFKVAK